MTRNEMMKEFYERVKRFNPKASAIVLEKTNSRMFELIYAYVTVVNGCVVWQYLLLSDGTVNMRLLTSEPDYEKEIFKIKA